MALPIFAIPPPVDLTLTRDQAAALSHLFYAVDPIVWARAPIDPILLAGLFQTFAERLTTAIVELDL